MTRYTRARGCKASNERLPNEATPWSLMKQQLEESKEENSVEIRESEEKLLKDKGGTFCSNAAKDVNYGWAEFGDKPKSTIKIKKSRLERNCTSLVKNSENNVIHNVICKSSSGIKKSQEVKDIEIRAIDSRKKKSDKEQCKLKDSLLQFSEERLSTSQINISSNVLSKRQKRNQKRKLDKESYNNESKQLKKDITVDESLFSEVKKNITEKSEYKRRKPDIGVTKVMIDGMEVEIVKYDGFPIRKEDARRLAELKQEMMMKGIPKSNVDLTIKMERRRAEKALARIKKLICFNCRVSGHKLSDCPELDKEGAGTGVCFKCGSTEHSHLDCKVNKSSTYRYAKCFICHEQGHISAQCPDNPKGIYPHGGCCKICGAVTHLKKDCPESIKIKENDAVTVEKMNDFTVETLQKDVKQKDVDEKRSKNKIIKF